MQQYYLLGKICFIEYIYRISSHIYILLVVGSNFKFRFFSDVVAVFTYKIK